MNRFASRRKLLTIPVLAALVAGGGNVLSTALRLDYHSTDDRGLAVFAYQQRDHAADILFFGSSHMKDGIRADIIEEVLDGEGAAGSEVFNLGQLSSNLLISRIALRDVVQSHGCPAVVVVEVAPEVFNRDIEWPDNLRDRARLSDLLSLLPYANTLDRVGDLLSAQTSGLQRLFERLYCPPDATLVARVQQRGGSSYSREEPGTGREGPVSAKYARKVYRETYWRNFALSRLQQDALEDVLSLSHTCNAGLLLLRVPSLAMTSPKDIERVDEVYARYIESFAAANELPYANLQWIDFGLGRQHYRNATHLNAQGAAIISRYVAREYLLPMIGGAKR